MQHVTMKSTQHDNVMILIVNSDLNLINIADTPTIIIQSNGSITSIIGIAEDSSYGILA